METTHQKAKSIFFQCKVAAKADRAVLFFQHSGALCLTWYWPPLVPRGVLNALLGTCDTRRLESGSIGDLLQYLFQNEGGGLMAARGGYCLRTQLSQGKESSRMSCLQREICSQHEFFFLFEAVSHPLLPRPSPLWAP